MRNLRLVHSTTRLDYSSALPRRADSAPAVAPLDPDVRALLEHVRIIAPLPRGVRARVLARARAVVAAAARPSAAAGRAPPRRRSRTIC